MISEDVIRTEAVKIAKVKDYAEYEQKGYSHRWYQADASKPEIVTIEVYGLQGKKQFKVEQTTKVTEV